jgi:hypothetical protein
VVAAGDDAIRVADIAELAAGLRRLLDSIQAGQITADSGVIARLEGAALALEALASAQTNT